jgi:hypothetical protein
MGRHVVLIGGSWDGRLVAIPDDYHHQELIIPFVDPIYDPCHSPGMNYLPNLCEMGHQIYRPTKWKGDKMVFEIYALDGLTADDVMERLLLKATIANPCCPKCDVTLSEKIGGDWFCKKCDRMFAAK